MALALPVSLMERQDESDGRLGLDTETAEGNPDLQHSPNRQVQPKTGHRHQAIAVASFESLSGVDVPCALT